MGQHERQLPEHDFRMPHDVTKDGISGCPPLCPVRVSVMGPAEPLSENEVREWKRKWASFDSSGLPTGEYPPPVMLGKPWHDTISSASLMEARRDSGYKAAHDFMIACGIPNPTPDAIEQLLEAFLPALKIMCDPSHPWDPGGATWRKSGVLGILTDCKKKFERLWERGWKHGKRHDDSGFDLLNFVGFYMRSADNGWGDWGNPKIPDE